MFFARLTAHTTVSALLLLFAALLLEPTRLLLRARRKSTGSRP
jgi:hypothetical protein